MGPHEARLVSVPRRWWCWATCYADPWPHWLAGTAQAAKEEASRVSEHLLCARQHAKPDTHTVLLKDHNDLARHGFLLIVQGGH